MIILFPNFHFNPPIIIAGILLYFSLAFTSLSVPSLTTFFNHTDHLGSTIVTTNQAGSIVETTDYSSFGHQTHRSSHQGVQQTEKYTGHTYDPESDLLYAQARYYRGSLGRFLGQDPLHWTTPKEYLTDPQQQNSYSYARNNPLKFVDTTGKYVESAVDIASLGLSVQDYQKNPSLGNAAFVGLDVAALFLPVPALAGYARHGSGLFNVGKMGEKVSNLQKADNTLNVNVNGELKPLFRGGDSLKVREGVDVKVNKQTGLIDSSKTQGISVNTNPDKVSVFGVPRNLIGSLPKSLNIRQQGLDPGHFVITPSRDMTVRTFQKFVNKIKLK